MSPVKYKAIPFCNSSSRPVKSSLSVIKGRLNKSVTIENLGEFKCILQGGKSSANQ